MTIDDSIAKTLARGIVMIISQIEADFDRPEFQKGFEEWLAKRRAEEKKTEARDAQI